MVIKINNQDLKKLKNIKDPKINKYLNKLENISEDEPIDFMEYLYDKSNECLSKNDYSDTTESLVLEKIADYIYDKTN